MLLKTCQNILFEIHSSHLNTGPCEMSYTCVIPYIYKILFRCPSPTLVKCINNECTVTVMYRDISGTQRHTHQHIHLPYLRDALPAADTQVLSRITLAAIRWNTNVLMCTFCEFMRIYNLNLKEDNKLRLYCNCFVILCMWYCPNLLTPT